MNSKLKVGLIVGGFFLALSSVSALSYAYKERRDQCSKWLSARHTPMKVSDLTNRELSLIDVACYKRVVDDAGTTFSKCLEDGKEQAVSGRSRPTAPAYYGLPANVDDAHAHCELFD